MSEVILHSDYSKKGLEESFFADEAEEKAATAAGDDAFLKQIDDFRTKAVHVQQMVTDRESKVADLEATIQKLEEENRQLAQQLEEKQTAADGIKADVESQVDRMMTDVRGTFEGIDSKLSEDIHKENVRAYRNIQKLFEENDHSAEYQQQMKKGFSGLKAGVVIAVILSLLNTLAVAYLVLDALGILDMIGLTL